MAAMTTSSLAAGEYMQINSHMPIWIVGIVTQGRGVVSTIVTQYVTGFRVEYGIDNAIASTVAMQATFSMTSGARREHLFLAPVYAQYIRMFPTSWVGPVSMEYIYI